MEKSVNLTCTAQTIHPSSELINLNDVIHFWMGNALSQKLIFAYQWLAFTEHPLNATFTCRGCQIPGLFLLEFCAVCDSLKFAISRNWMYLRKNNDDKIEPVPWVTKESEFSYTEASCKDFDKWLKSIYSSKSVPRHQNPMGY